MGRGRPVVDLTGQRFGRLVVIRQAQREQEMVNRSARWECRCDCGNITQVMATNLRNGNSKSCGCLHKETLAKRKLRIDRETLGRRYGELEVLEKTVRPADPEMYKHARTSWWRCRCSCGREVVLPKQYFANASRAHCGCRAQENREAQRKIGHDGTYVKVSTAPGPRELRTGEGNLYGVMRKDRTCTQCGKVFDCYAGENWAWKRTGHNSVKILFCSYGCMRRYDKEHPVQKGRAQA